MDDFILLTKTKEDAKILKTKIEIFCKEELNLELNHKSRYYPHKFGLNFCGYKIWTTHKLLRTNSKLKIKRKIKGWNNLWKAKKINLRNTVQCLNSWLGHAKHANTYKLRNEVLHKCDFLYLEDTIEL